MSPHFGSFQRPLAADRTGPVARTHPSRLEGTSRRTSGRRAAGQENSLSRCFLPTLTPTDGAQSARVMFK